MAYELDLSGCWGKFYRATRHIDTLIAEIDGQGFAPAKAGGPEHAHLIPLRQEFDAEHHEIRFRIQRLMTIGIEWPLIVGDAVHNLRCSLDHLAWQLAIRYFDGVAPTSHKIIREIQFPVCANAAAWANDKRRRYMTSEDAGKVEQFQPFANAPTADGDFWLGGLAGFGGFDNIDKHRTLHLAYVAAHQLVLTAPPLDDFADCSPVVTDDGEIRFSAFGLPGVTPHLGDIVCSLPVKPAGPNPRVRLEPRLSAFVALHDSKLEIRDVVYSLRVFAVEVSGILNAFTPP